MPDYPESDETFLYLAHELGNRGITYKHLHDIGALMNCGDPITPFEDINRMRYSKAEPLKPVILDFST